jgi:hypothetical protein
VPAVSSPRGGGARWAYVQAAVLFGAAVVGVVALVQHRPATAPPVPPGTPLALTAVSPYVKVQPGDTDLRAAPALQAPRGGFAALQVAVAPLGGDAQLQVVAPRMTGAGGSLPPSAVAVFAERNVTVHEASVAVPDGLIGPVPDPLVPPSHAQVASDGRVVLYVRISVPEGAAPGPYRGLLTVASGPRRATLPLALTVAPAQLGPREGLATYFVVWPDKADQREGRKGASAAYRRLLTREGFDDGQDGGLVDLGGPRAGESMTTAAARLARLAAALRTRRPGVRIVSYFYDEPGPAQYADVRAWGDALRRADPTIEQLVTAPPNPGLRGAAGILSMHLAALGPGVAAETQRAGAEPWSYSSCCETPGDATMLLDDHATSNLAVAPATWLQGGRGLLYWGVSVFTADPWKQAAQRIDEPGNRANGDGVLLYPGRPVGLPGPVPSLRLELTRAGLQLAALADVAQRRGHGAEARAILAAVLPGTGKYDPNPAAWEDAAAQLLQAASAA